MSKPDLNEVLRLVCHRAKDSSITIDGFNPTHQAVSMLENAIVLAREEWQEALEIMGQMLDQVHNCCGCFDYNAKPSGDRARAFLEKHQNKQ